MPAVGATFTGRANDSAVKSTVRPILSQCAVNTLKPSVFEAEGYVMLQISRNGSLLATTWAPAIDLVGKHSERVAAVNISCRSGVHP